MTLEAQGRDLGADFGIDFGTTNSSIGCVNGSGEVQLARFAFGGGLTESYRSLLYLEQAGSEQFGAPGPKKLRSWTGPEAIEHYLAAETKGRLIQSLKSFLSSRTLLRTDIFGKPYTIEDLIARILRDLREKAQQQFGTEIRSAVVGLPVRFVGAEQEDDDAYAQGRLEEAFQMAGFESVEFEMEPVAAAAYYESTLDHYELILIGDFGGGTSDFSLLHVGPGQPGLQKAQVRPKKVQTGPKLVEPKLVGKARKTSNILGNAGVGLAGDAFDAKIVRHLVAPALGAGTKLRSMDKILPVPTWVYAKLERWHHLSFLGARDVMNMLRTVRVQAIEPDKIEALIHLITEVAGYALHRAVQKVKCELSTADQAEFRFADGVIDLQAVVQRSSFEEWIAPEIAQIETCVDGLLASTGVDRKDVDRVFLTGGSSFVPAVRKVFETRFGEARIRTGNEFTSVVRGLALRAGKRDPRRRAGAWKSLRTAPI